MNPNYPGGLKLQESRLEAEGHKLVARGKRLFVEDHEARRVRPGSPEGRRLRS